MSRPETAPAQLVTLHLEAMNCEEFLARHSDFLDEELGAEGAVEMRLHLAGCQRCGRYDRVLRRGLALVRDVEPVLPSSDLYLGLQQHLERNERPWRAAASARPRAPVAATVAVAGVVALIAGSVFFRATGGSAPTAGGPLEPVTAGPGRQLWADPISSGMDVVGPGLPVVWRWPHAAPAPVRRDAPAPVAPRPSVLDRGPYTPLVVEAPDYGQSMAVSVLDPYAR